MSGARLPFAFARDNQVALDGDALLTGPEASANGLRAARLIAARPLDIDPLDAESFPARLAQLYDSGAEDAGAEVAFDLEEARADTARDQTGKPISCNSRTSRQPASITRPRTPHCMSDVPSSSPK